MNRLIKNALILVASLTISMHSMALGLGELTLKSTLNRPLEAEIQLLDAEGLSTWEIKPTLASPQVFAEVGIERPYFLTQIRFSVVGDKIRLTTKDAVTEPFLDFLVELNWPSGRVMREYTVLLDPPTFDDELYEPLAETPDSGETQFNGGAAAAQTQAPSVAESSRLKAPAPTARPVAAPGEYLVKPRDTLWSIALQTRPDRSISPQQMMLAIQRRNPNAFIKDNINLLKSNERLKIPSEAEINSMTFRQAVAEVARQNQAFQAGVGQIDATAGAGTRARANTRSTGGEVRLVTPDNQEGRSAGASGDVGSRGGSGRAQALENELAMTLENLDKSKRENAELTQQLKDLEEQIEAMQKLVSLKDDQLTNMQVNAGQADKPLAETPPALDTTPEAANAAAPAAPAAPAQPQPIERSPNFGKLDRYKAPPSEPSIFDLLLSPMVLGVLLALLLGAGGYVYWKRKQFQDVDEQEVAGMAEGPELDAAPQPEGADDFNFQEAPSGEQDDFAFGGFNEGSAGSDDGLQLPDNLFGPEEGSDGLDLTLDDLAAQELEGLDDVETDSAKKDPLETADYAIAYGNFDEAEEILAEALSQEPERTDLRLKRLELLAAKDDAVGFEEEERSIKATSGDAHADQIDEYRSRLTAAVAAAGVAGLAAEALSDDESTSLEAGVSEETVDFDATLDEGLDFADALDLSDSESSLDDLELDESLLDVSDETLSSDTDDIPDLADLELDDAPATDSDDDGLEFDLSGLDDLEFDTADAEIADAGGDDSSDDNSLEFDLEGLDELTVDSTTTESQSESVQAEDDNLLDFDLDELDLPEAEETQPQVAEAADNLPESTEEDVFDLDLELSEDSLELGSSDEEAIADVSDDTLDSASTDQNEASTASVPELDLSSFDFDFPETRSNESSVAEAAPDSDSAITEPDDESMDFDLGELDSSDLQTLDDALASNEESTDVSAASGDSTEELALDEELDFSLDDLDELTSASDAAIETNETNAPDPVEDTQSEESEAFDLGDLDFDLESADQPVAEITEESSSEDDVFDLSDLAALDAELDEASNVSSEESLSIPEVTETTDAADEFNLADLEADSTPDEQDGADAFDLSDLSDDLEDASDSGEEASFDLADLEALENSAFDVTEAESSTEVQEGADLEAYDLSLDETVDFAATDATAESSDAEVAEVEVAASEKGVDILDLDAGDISELDLDAFAADISDDDLTIDEDNLDDLFGAHDLASSDHEVVAGESESDIGLPDVADSELEAPEVSELETLAEDSAADEFDLEDFDLDDLEVEGLDVDSLEEVSTLDDTQVEAETLAETPAPAPTTDSSLGDLDMDSDDFDFLGGNDESATKLDLARAYVDMGDAEGARELLDEVIKDGTADQQKEAQSMLESIS